MKSRLKNLVLVSALMVAGSAGADYLSDLEPYIGVDYYQSWMKGKKNYSQIFSKSYPGATLYLGTKFVENFGIELGFDWAARKTRNWTITRGAQFFGSTNVRRGLTGTTKIRRTGGHLDFIGFLPINDSFEIFGAMGYGWVHAKVEETNITMLTPARGGQAGLSVDGSALSSLSGKGRSVLRVGIGANLMVSDMVGIRAKLAWESTSTLRINFNADGASLGYSKKGFNDSGTLAVGTFVKF